MVKRILGKAYRMYKRATEEKAPETYIIDGFKVHLGKNHVLPIYQKRFPMYDRFIPYLATCAKNEDDIVIDIGANVGDTTLAMIKHTKAQIVCVEPADVFYELCLENISNASNEFSSRVRPVQAFIAQNSEEHYDVQIGKGTAVRKPTSVSSIPTYTIPELIKSLSLELDKIAIIKTDTDGYDSECIMSLGDRLQELSPLIYFENEIINHETYMKYQKTKQYLDSCGFSSFFVFDAYGNFLCETDMAGCIDIDSYLYRISTNMGTRSFPYVDILVAKKDKRDLCRNAINDYISSI